MEINEWWANDSDQRFWMEITDRSDVGNNLYAPQTQQGGQPYWGYELITRVAPGDIVLHWHKSLHDEPGIAGWSRATGVYEYTTISWQARGTVGRAKGSTNSRPAWMMPLQDYTPLTDPVTISEVRAAEIALRQVKQELETVYPGNLYFPFQFSDKRELRAQQTYFVKMPREVLAVFDALDLFDEHAPAAGGGRAAPRPVKKTRSVKNAGYMLDVATRRAIERRAVDLAVEWLVSEGYAPADIQDVGTTHSYDLVATKGGVELRVEVKGTSADGATHVELTHNEVANSRDHQPTALYVAEGVEYERNSDGSVTAFGGHGRVLQTWTAHAADLLPIRFRYTLPDKGWRS
ncbi:protein NO VEIN domain-containing protein [Ornithinicoccus halotolerans]|uniref:protein NO VEIN domain-containing protein n=1 Tax=Ornithinicoccus halotolerans TaxID=1748220 RepID=UPI0012969D10|nr:DUF3883 domain-containing protein [Ornithinicoccus halotolerans]